MGSNTEEAATVLMTSQGMDARRVIFNVVNRERLLDHRLT